MGGVECKGGRSGVEVGEVYVCRCVWEEYKCKDMGGMYISDLLPFPMQSMRMVAYALTSYRTGGVLRMMCRPY